MADWTIIKLLAWTESYFKDRNREGENPETPKNHSTKTTLIDSPRLTAEILLAHTLGIRRLDLYLQYDRPLDRSELSQFKTRIKRRLAGEPVAYITGSKGFYDSNFYVAKGVLIPRPDTETLVGASLAFLSDTHGKSEAKQVLELGTGSGAVVVSLAKAAPEHFYFACDLSLTALKIAQKNGRQIAENRVRFFAGSWFSALRPEPYFDLVVSNPPYIPTGDIQGLQAEIRNFEPLSALDGGSDGLDCYRRILDQAHRFIVPGGTLMLEIGYDQRPGLESIAQSHSRYSSGEIVKDLAGHDRVVKFKKID